MSDVLLDSFGNALFTALCISLIPLGASMSVGLVLGVLQVVTQIQEQSLSFVCKVIAAVGALYVTRGYWTAQLEHCFLYSFENLAEM